MPKLNRSAAQLSTESMPPDLPERIRLNFHKRYNRRKRSHLAICSFMLVFGLWLVSPVIAPLFERLSFPLTGSSLVGNLADVILDLASFFAMVWDGAINFQSILLGTLSLSVLIGMICMGAGAIWGIAYFIPPKAVQFGD